MTKIVQVANLGLIEYKEAWDYQTTLFDETVQLKIKNKKEETQISTKNHLLFCEHPHVYTIGKSGKADHLLYSQKALEEKGVTFYKTNRGGDITYHGPGQLVGYPIFDLAHFFEDIGKYMRFLEEAIILTLDEYTIKAGRIKGMTGVWLDWEAPSKARKICAMGVKSSRWVTMHGFALNVHPDLSFFGGIVPCGITDKAVTSMKQELGKEVDIEEVRSKLTVNLANLFDFEISNQS